MSLGGPVGVETIANHLVRGVLEHDDQIDINDIWCTWPIKMVRPKASFVFASDRSHFGIEQPVALVFSYKANVTDSNETWPVGT